VLVRFGKWDEILAEPPPDESRLFSRAERHYARAVALANLGRTDEARAELKSLDEAAAGFTDEWKCGNNRAAEVIAVARKMAEGEIAYREGRKDDAFRLLREAVTLEEQLSYDEPPGWMQPVRHALGALLLDAARPAEAEEVYRADLKRHPKNAWSLLGLQQSLAVQQKTDEAAAMSPQVAEAWSRADVKPPASCYCGRRAESLPVKK
jgi:tetratricopeptide (TPR) repeat protein